MPKVFRWWSSEIQLVSFWDWILLPRTTIHSYGCWATPEIHTSSFSHEDMGMVFMVFLHRERHPCCENSSRCNQGIQRIRVRTWILDIHCSHSWLRLLEHKTSRAVRLPAPHPPLCRRSFHASHNLLSKSFHLYHIWFYEWNGCWRRMSLGFWPNLGKCFNWDKFQWRYIKTSPILHRNVQAHYCWARKMDTS